MLKWISYISFVFTILFSLLLVVSLLKSTKKKNLKTRKKIRTLRRVYSGAAAFFFIAGLVLQFMAAPKGGMQEFINRTTPVEAYQNLVKVNAAKGIDALPERIYGVANNYYVATGMDDVYGHLAVTTVTTDDQGNPLKTVTYQSGLSYKDTQSVTGGEGILAVLSDKKLTVSGAFEYLQYERDQTILEAEVYSKNCTYAAGNSNNLFYVSDGDLFSCGYNNFGQLGDGTERNRINGVKILENVASVSVSETHTLAVDIFGNLYGFGSNSYSEMGNRTTAQSITPILLMEGVREAQAGRNFSVVLAKNGMVYAAGRNHMGQLGTGDNRDYANYQKVLEGVVKISVCGNSCAALTATGTLYVWGDNANGQLGITGEVLNVPTLAASDIYDVAMGQGSMGVIKLNRDVYVTGKARPIQNLELFQAIYQFGATVPADRMYREMVTMPVRPENY